MNDISSDDKLWAALSWAIPLIGIIVLVSEDKKSRPFQKYHAVNSLAFSVAFFVIISILSVVTFGIGSCLAVIWLVAFYWAYQAYQGQWVTVPLLTDFVKKQGWV
jgi:uncharacterized membrane protein